MYHDTLIIDTNEKDSIIELLIEKFNCEKSISEDSIHINNKEKNLEIILIDKTSKNDFILIIDYPNELKKFLEKELLLILPGNTRLPTLKEFAKFLEELKNKKVTKEQLRNYLTLNSTEFSNLLTDFELSSTKKRATPTMKKAWILYQNIITE